jgi:transposase-like protein
MGGCSPTCSRGIPHSRRVGEIPGCSVHFALMRTCPSWQHPATNRDGYDVFGRQRCHCRPCHRDFTAHFSSAFSGYRWPLDVIVIAVRWYCSE